MKKTFKLFVAGLAIVAISAGSSFACIGLGCNTAAVNGQQQSVYGTQAYDSSPTMWFESGASNGWSGASTFAGQNGSFTADANGGIKIPFVKSSADASGFTGGQVNGQSAAFGGNSAFWAPGSSNFQGAIASSDAVTGSGAFAEGKGGFLPTAATTATAAGEAGQGTSAFSASTKPGSTASIYAIEGNNASYNASSKDCDLGLFKANAASVAGGSAHVDGATMVKSEFGGIPGQMKYASTEGITGNSGVATAYGEKLQTNVNGSGSMEQGSQVIGNNPSNWAQSNAAGNFCYNNTGWNAATGQGATAGSTFSTLSNVPNGVSSFTAAQQSSFAK